MIITDTLPSRSGRIVLIPPREEDDAAVAVLNSHPETRRHLPFFPTHTSVEDARAQRLQRTAEKTRILFHIHLSTPRPDKSTFVGLASMSHIDTAFQSCHIGISIDPGLARGGLATDALHAVLTYAFDEWKLHRVVFITAVENIGMRGWLDMAGATLEATQREGWPDGRGRYIDRCVYGILEKEWRDAVRIRLEERIDRVNLAKV
ncbi:acyl-CoA N-acyltransferase [Mycena vitilis]|nr:acyl-CoA N-acyltransferase [Mycena vitilis]